MVGVEVPAGVEAPEHERQALAHVPEEQLGVREVVEHAAEDQPQGVDAVSMPQLHIGPTSSGCPGQDIRGVDAVGRVQVERDVQARRAPRRRAARGRPGSMPWVCALTSAPRRPSCVTARSSSFAAACGSCSGRAAEARTVSGGPRSSRRAFAECTDLPGDRLPLVNPIPARAMVAGLPADRGSSLVRLFFILLLLVAAPALAQSADDAEQCLNLGKTEADAGSDRRLEACTRAIESGALTQDKLAATLGARGATYLRKGDLDRAIADYDAALRLSPDDADVLLNRAMAHGEKGDYPEAITDFKAVIARNPQSVPAYNGRCYTLALMGDAVRALEDCDRALALQPNTPYILDSRAYAFLRPAISAAPQPTTT